MNRKMMYIFSEIKRLNSFYAILKACSKLEQRPGFFGGAVMDAEAEAGLDEIRRHRKAHASEADEADRFSHRTLRRMDQVLVAFLSGPVTPPTSRKMR